MKEREKLFAAALVGIVLLFAFPDPILGGFVLLLAGIAALDGAWSLRHTARGQR